MPSSSDKMAISLSGHAMTADLQVRRAVVEEGLSRLTETRIEVLTKDRSLTVESLIGQPVNIDVDPNTDGEKRYFRGICTSVEYVGELRAASRYVIETRPRLWYLTRSWNCRVYQGKTTPEIIQAILGDYGFSSNLKDRLSGSYEARDYCIQYDETDFDFLSRLMEEEGIYYYFKHDAEIEDLVLADGVSGHDPMPGETIEFFSDASSFDRSIRHVYDIQFRETTTSGKVTLADHDFEKSNPAMSSIRSIPKGSHGHRNYEVYRHPGHYRQPGLGESRARVRMEAAAVRHLGWTIAGSVYLIGNGQTFKLTGHPKTRGETEFLVTGATHFMQTDAGVAQDPGMAEVVPLPADLSDEYRCVFRAIPKNVPYRAPLETPWPRIASIQTGLVVGPDGEEIHTDEYGRVRVHLFWDRLGEKNERDSVWIRVATPWAGSNWGMIHIPRIGNEVVVQFENGDPDRPIVTGMLYNANSMPPWTLPDNMTQSGIKTNSSKEGDGYNELMFEDKKGEELVRFQAEKDYEQIVKNNATITVGLEKEDPGDMTLTIKNDLTETLKSGNHTFTVETGEQTIAIKKDKTETIEGKCTTTVTGNVEHTVQQGNVTETVQLGNFKLKTSVGKVEIEAMQEILLKVGGSSIKIDQMGVTIVGTAMLEAKAPMTQVKGDALLILKGGMTMIN